MVEAAKKIASMWTEMAQLLRFTVFSETSYADNIIFLRFSEKSVYIKRGDLRKTLWL